MKAKNIPIFNYKWRFVVFADLSANIIKNFANRLYV